jgi:hypothetical protein
MLPNINAVLHTPVLQHICRDGTHAMPTPFTHLQLAYRLLSDSQLPETIQVCLAAELPAYLLGSISADARIPGKDRDAAHFYRYDTPMLDHPWRVMTAQYPSLMQPHSPAQQAFIAGYVAHLAADEYWSLHMLKPHFAESDWGSGIRARFFVLHLLLIFQDERDLKLLPLDTGQQLQQCQPAAWLPFMPDAVLYHWRDLIAEQLPNHSQTLEIFGGRIATDPAQLRQMVDDAALMYDRLWQHITPTMLHDIEENLYAFSRDQLLRYWTEATLN